MRNKFLHFAAGAIASLAMIGTFTYASPATAMPGGEKTKTDLITSGNNAIACTNSRPGEANYMLFTGAFATILVGGLCLGLWSHRNRKRQRELTLQEQIQLLERIWKMTPQR